MVRDNIPFITVQVVLEIFGLHALMSQSHLILGSPTGNKFRPPPESDKS